MFSTMSGTGRIFFDGFINVRGTQHQAACDVVASSGNDHDVRIGVRPTQLSKYHYLEPIALRPYHQRQHCDCRHWPVARSSSPNGPETWAVCATGTLSPKVRIVTSPDSLRELTGTIPHAFLSGCSEAVLRTIREIIKQKCPVLARLRFRGAIFSNEPNRLPRYCPKPRRMNSRGWTRLVRRNRYKNGR